MKRLLLIISIFLFSLVGFSQVVESPSTASDETVRHIPKFGGEL